MKKEVIYIEVAPSIKRKAEKLTRKHDLNMRQLISKLIREAK
ncbi:MAG: hypothetical protein OEX12_05860 [Gammaproteobacteria bacterium]|nr:hypothetical protein [Gammaproteobacteria bacterium]